MAEEKKHVGRILLRRKLLSQAELDAQLEKQRLSRDGMPLASRLAASGAVSETDALRALSEQFGVPGIDLNQVVIPLEHLDFVPREVAESSRVLPVLARDDRLFLAMANPQDKRVIDELEFVTGRRVYPYVAMTSTLERTIRAAYDAKELGQTEYAGPAARATAPAGLGPEAAGLGGSSGSARVAGAGAPPPLVVDERIESASAEGEISTNDLEPLGEEVSQLAFLSPEMRAAAGMAPAQASTSGKKILVVDDEEDIRKLVRRLLVEKGHEIVEADRGLVALRMVKEEMPDLIVLDAMLPEVHGFDIAKRLKDSDKYGSIPILMMSAVHRGWRIAEDLKVNYGIEDYIEKPFRIADLLSRVARLLEHGKKARPPSVYPEQMDRTAGKYLEDGIAAYKNGEVDLAISMLRKGITIDPLAYRLRYHLALIYGKQGQIYEGITELEKAIDLNAKHFPALKNLAVLYEKAGFRHKAIEMWERCIHVAPDPETRESIKAHLVKLL